MDDLELTNSLKRLFETAGDPTPERVEEKYIPGLTAHLKSELFEVTEDMDALIHYKDKAIYLKRERREAFTERETLSIPFKAIPSIIRFLAWACDEKPIGKE